MHGNESENFSPHFSHLPRVCSSSTRALACDSYPLPPSLQSIISELRSQESTLISTQSPDSDWKLPAHVRSDPGPAFCLARTGNGRLGRRGDFAKHGNGPKGKHSSHSRCGNTLRTHSGTKTQTPGRGEEGVIMARKAAHGTPLGVLWLVGLFV